MSRIRLAVLFLLVFPGLLEAAEASPWTVEDVILAESASDFQISPDGKFVVWVKSQMDRDKGERVKHLIRTSLTDNRETELTRGEHSCTWPRWSPDGKYLAFLSDRPGPKKKNPGKSRAAPRLTWRARGLHHAVPRRTRDEEEEENRTQLWLLDPTGGEPWQLTELKRDITAIAWLDAGTLLFTAQEEPTLREQLLKEGKKDTSIVVDDDPNEPPVRLFKIEVKSKKITRLSANLDRIQSFRVSPDGRYVVAIHARSLRFVYDNQIRPVTLLHDLKAGTSREILDARLNPQEIRWQPDSRGFFFTAAYTTHPRYLMAYVTRLHHHDLASGKTREVNLDWERGLADQNEHDGRAGIVVLGDGFLALLADGVRHRLARFSPDRDGWKRQFVTSQHAGNIFGFQLSKDGKTLVYAHSTAATPTQWYRARLEAARIVDPVAITKLNEDLQEKPRAKTEIIRWKGALDEEVEGILYYPHGWTKGKKYPLVLMIHGGPFGADFDAWEESWAYPANLLAQKGAFVFKPNYHGSSNYGLKWAESIANGKYYDLPCLDLEKGVDFLIAQGLVEAARLGTMGWSNGAILSVALIARQPRYRACSAGAGGAEWVGDWGACEFGAAFSNYYLGKSPIEDPQLYIKMAPLYQFGRVRTPTIFFQGDADRAVPVHHGWSQFRTLQQLGKVDTRLILFPGEKHSLVKMVHQKRKLTEELKWLERHLFADLVERDPSLKRHSPLAGLLQLHAAKKSGSRYGELVNGVLVPETVRHEGIDVGRFEVTAAQFASFDPKYRVEPGKENFPATGISFARAVEYCRWLSQKTGRVYRLPNAEEADKLYRGDAEGENTLDHWAGYPVNPEDARRLLEQVKKLGVAPLLSEVGKFKGAGEEQLIFDLNGNAAEWTTTIDGKPHLRGGSADTPADERLGQRKPAPAYQGFRVVRPKASQQR